MNKTKDRAMLEYLMQQFDSEEWNCDRCGWSEETSKCDSASVLRRYLSENKPEAFPWHSVSVDVSTCDTDANHRIFANITGWVDGTILAEKTSQNFVDPFNATEKNGAKK